MSDLIPEGWKIKSLDKEIDILSGFPFQSSSFVDDSSNIGLIRIRDIQKQQLKTFYEGEYDDIYVVKKGDILVGMDGDFNITKWKIKNALLNQRICKVSARSNSEFDSNFLFHFLDPELKVINNITVATTVKHLSVKDLRGITKPFPPLPEQQKIAAILTSVDEVIEKTQAQIAKLKDLKTGMMQELLTRGVGIDGKPHTEFKDSPVGRIPKVWKVNPLDNYVSFLSYGFTNPMPEAETGPYMITAKDIYGLKVQYSKARKTTQCAFNDLLTRKSRPEVNDILLTKDGTLGRVALVETENCCINQSVAVMTPNEKILPKFLLYLLASPIYQREMLDKAGGSTIKHIYITVVDKMTIAVPTLCEQECIVNIIDALLNKLALSENKLLKINDTKKALMQDLLTGKVRVTVPAPSSLKASRLKAIAG